MTDQLRVGMVNFINTAPIYTVWKQRGNNERWQVVEAVPARLNRMLEDGKLDIGIVSSHEYALHPENYYVLDSLSISSSGAVGSVYLFADCPLSSLHGRTVQLSPQSQTSNSLVKIILENFLDIRPDYRSGSDSEKTVPAMVAVGPLWVGEDSPHPSARKDTFGTQSRRITASLHSNTRSLKLR